MKGVVVLLLAVSAFANPVSLTQFFAGYNQGVESPQTCLEDTEKCGEFFGQFVAVVGEYLKDKPLEELIGASTQEVQLFMTGLVAGLTQSNATVSLCVSDFTNANYQLATLYNAIMSIIQYGLTNPMEILSFACSGVSMVSFQFLQDCHFQVLWHNIETMGLNLLVDRYLKNSCDLNTAVIGLTRCNKDISWCGHSIGVIVREVFDWGI